MTTVHRLYVLVLALPILGCFAHMDQKAAARRGSAAVRQACDRAGLEACAQLANGYKQYISEDTQGSAQQITKTVYANPNVDIPYFTKTLDVAAILAEKQSRDIKRFNGFFVSVARGARNTDRSAVTASQGKGRSGAAQQDRLAEIWLYPQASGCQSDTQCKDDRVCVNGVCVGPAVARRMERRLLAMIGADVQAPNPHIVRKPARQTVTPLPVVPPENEMVKKDRARKVIARCERGKAEGCYAAGILYETGRGITANIQAAAASYKRACSLGQMSACVRLGNIYYYGRNAAINQQEAYELYMHACDKENMYGCANVAMLSQHGLGTHKDIGKAIQYFNLACDMGHEISCLKIIRARLTPDKYPDTDEEHETQEKESKNRIKQNPFK